MPRATGRPIPTTITITITISQQGCDTWSPFLKSCGKPWKDLPGSLCKDTGKPLDHFGEGCVKLLGRLCEAFGKHLGSRSEAFGKPWGTLWEVTGEP